MENQGFDTNHLIPKDKYDLVTARKLQHYSYKEIEVIIPNLLEWLQDMNWPVAKPVSEYLLSIQNHISDDLVMILNNSEDEVWKHWIIMIFGPSTENPREKK